MRYLTYRHDGRLAHGRLTADGTAVDEIGPGDLLLALENGPLADAAVTGTRHALDAIQILPPLPRPPKVLAVAANYASHVVNSGGKPVDPTRATPRLFLKPSSAVAAHDADLVPPHRATQVDWEVELAVVIGTRCRNVAVGDTLDVVAGYMTANDISVRTYEYEFERDEASIHPFFDWLAGKWGDGFAPFGPYLVGADEVPDPGALSLHLDVNGEVKQAGSTSELLFGVPEIISYASSFMTLEPGDVIETGTTGGAGVETGVYLSPGDVMTARVGDLGDIRTVVRPWRSQ